MMDVGCGLAGAPADYPAAADKRAECDAALVGGRDAPHEASVYS